MMIYGYNFLNLFKFLNQIMKKFNLVIVLLLFAVFSCKDDDSCMEVNPNIEPEPIDELITGYNIRWRDMPTFSSSNIISLTDTLNPEMLRYPGGTLTHKWNWETGLPVSPTANDTPHLLDDVKVIAEATDSKIIFVLDVVNRSLQNQIDMLRASNLPIEYIELGNELYADDYETEFPDGATYANLINEWVPTLESEFPNAKIGIVLLGRTAGNDRKNNWNTSILNNLTVDIDAHIYHIYVNENETVQDRIGRFNEVFIENTGKELWVTEYGAKSQNLNEAMEISDYVDSIADIALNHCVLARSQNFSKVTLDGNELTEEGKAFVEKYN